MLMQDMNTGSVFVDSKSAASIKTEEDIFRTRFVVDHYTRKDFSKLFRNSRLADPHGRIHNAKAIDKCRRWLDSHGMGMLSSQRAYVMATPSGTFQPEEMNDRSIARQYGENNFEKQSQKSSR